MIVRFNTFFCLKRVSNFKIMKFNEFTKLFPDEESCIKYFRELKESRGYAHIVVQLNFIGMISINQMIVNNVHSESHYVAERLWNHPIFLFK
jgi:hypothetical protein